MRGVVAVLALGLVLTGCTGDPPSPVPTTGSAGSTDGPSLGTPRAVHRATTLPGGAFR